MLTGLIGSLLIKISLLLAVALLVDVCLRRRQVLILAAFWNAILLAIVLLPVSVWLIPQWTLPLPSLTSRVMESPDTVKQPSDVIIDREQRHGYAAPIQNSNLPLSESVGVSPLSAVSWIYALGMLILLARLLSDWSAVSSLRRGSFRVTDNLWCERLAFWVARLNVSGDHGEPGRSPSTSVAKPSLSQSRVNLLQSRLIDVPIAIGVRHPIIVIPEAMISGSTSQFVDAILTHELAHIQRADCAWQLLQRGIEMVLWFHPLVWIARRRMAFVRERACDDFAVRMLGDFRAYGETLLDVAAALVHKRSLRLGLAMSRSNSLERRLNAITQTTGNVHCIAPRRARWPLTLAVAGVAVALGCMVFGAASAQQTTSGTADQKKPTPSAVESKKTPPVELLAVTWQQVPESNNQPIEQPVWRPNGKQLSKVEAKALLDEVKSFQTHWWNQKEQLRPLVLIYRVPSGISTEIATAIVLPEGRRSWMGSWQYPLPGGLAKSACSPNRDELKNWIAKVDLDLKVPVERPQVIKTFDSLPDGPAEIEQGVRWYIDEKAGVDYSKPGSGESGFTAAVFEIPLAIGGVDSLTRYASQVWLKGEKIPLAEAYATVRKSHTGQNAFIRVSKIIQDPQAIERIEITRQQFRFERIKGVETRLDLLPPDK